MSTNEMALEENVINNEPSTSGSNGSNGRDASGKFTVGNRAGKGNPLGGAVAKLRAALIQAADEGDVNQIIRAMIDKAKSGDVAAAKVALEYLCGKAQSMPEESSDKTGPQAFVFRVNGY